MVAGHVALSLKIFFCLLTRKVSEGCTEWETLFQHYKRLLTN